MRIKHFFGTSDNAVKTQVWIAICVYVLVAIVRKDHLHWPELDVDLDLDRIAHPEHYPLIATSGN